MGKPAKLCNLTKGKSIYAFPGFVDTWNYMIDFIENLKGEGDNASSSESDEDASTIRLDRSIPDFPVIRGGGNGKGAKEKTLMSGSDSNVVFSMDSPESTVLKVDVYYV